MITFVLLAAVLTVAGVALVAVPLLRPAAQSPAPWAALGAAGILVAGSVVLYVVWSNWSWHAQPAADSPQTMVARLARRLEKNPNDLNGWLVLGRSYEVLEQYPLAVRSFERADRLAGGTNADALVGQAEALILQDENQLDGAAGRLIEKALTLDPKSGKALFFGGAAAIRRGDLPTARNRFASLLALNPPDNVRSVLQQQIAAIDQKLAGGPGPASADAAGAAKSAPGSAKGAAGPPPSGGASGGAATASSAAVRVKVTLGPSLSASTGAAAPLFVFVRDPSQPGPPLAVKRLTSHFPQTVELTSSDSMVPGRIFAPGQKVQVVARIALSGNPIAGKGDPFGEAPYLVGHDGLVDVVIDRLTP
jgi:cytochrome c-type biogenesis protein CcmH